MSKSLSFSFINKLNLRERFFILFYVLYFGFSSFKKARNVYRTFPWNRSMTFTFTLYFGDEQISVVSWLILICSSAWASVGGLLQFTGYQLNKQPSVTKQGSFDMTLMWGKHSQHNRAGVAKEDFHTEIKCHALPAVMFVNWIWRSLGRITFCQSRLGAFGKHVVLKTASSVWLEVVKVASDSRMFLSV